MFTPLARTTGQFDDPAFLRVVAYSLLLSGACFALLCAGTAYGLHHALAGIAWLAWLAGVLGGFLVVVSGLWLFLPLSVVIASLFMEPICLAVERRWYPALPAPQGAGFAAQLWDSLIVGLLVLALSAVSLVLALIIPGVGLVLGWAITAWALGRGLFVAVAMRRMSRVDANALYRQSRLTVLAQGAVLAIVGSVPLVNLLVPVLGTGCMVHVLMRTEAPVRTGESWG